MDKKKELWQCFFTNPTNENREHLILSYAPLIKYSAQRIYNGLPSNVDFDDLISYGSLGLIDAINRFNPQINNNFESYAVFRIRGAILDGLRKMDWAPQSLRRKSNKIEKTFFVLEQKMGRSPSDSELAKAMGITETQLEKELQDIGNLDIISLEHPIDTRESDLLTLGNILIDKKSPCPNEDYEKKELASYLEKAIKGLNEKEKIVVTLFYYEELTVKEISEVLELTAGRISQIHKKAILKLKSKLYQFGAQ